MIGVLVRNSPANVLANNTAYADGAEGSVGLKVEDTAGLVIVNSILTGSETGLSLSNSSGVLIFHTIIHGPTNIDGSGASLGAGVLLGVNPRLASVIDGDFRLRAVRRLGMQAWDSTAMLRARTSERTAAFTSARLRSEPRCEVVTCPASYFGLMLIGEGRPSGSWLSPDLESTILSTFSWYENPQARQSARRASLLRRLHPGVLEFKALAKLDRCSCPVRIETLISAAVLAPWKCRAGEWEGTRSSERENRSM